jgi:hypothetical protein
MACFEIEFGSQFLLQIKRVPIRIEVNLRQNPLHGSQREARRTKRIFIGSELDDIAGRQAEFPSDFLNGPPGLVDRQLAQSGIDGEIQDAELKLLIQNRFTVCPEYFADSHFGR